MLPFDNKPWAKQLATAVIISSVIGLICLALYLAHLHQLRIPECVGIFLLFLTIVPPNLAVLYKKNRIDADDHTYGSHDSKHRATAH